MKKALFAVLPVLLMTTSAFAARFPDRPGKITIHQEMTTERDSFGYSFNIEGLDGKDDCGISVASKEALTLRKGQILEGMIVNVQEKEVRQDADTVGKEATTQIGFKSQDGSVEVSVYCFGRGLLFPTAGLPKLTELKDMASGVVTFSK